MLLAMLLPAVGAQSAPAPDDATFYGNATLDGGDDEESPGLPALLALGIVVALAVARRRRWGLRSPHVFDTSK